MNNPLCFTVQCCYGYFVHRLMPDPENREPLSPYTGRVESIQYRIAYLALCLENSPVGHTIYSGME